MAAEENSSITTLTFPLIPLPIKEAVSTVKLRVIQLNFVSINSTSYKGSGEVPGYGSVILRVSINSTSYKGSGYVTRSKHF